MGRRDGVQLSEEIFQEIRNYSGERPLRVLNYIKLIKAVELLTTTGKTVYEIGYCILGIGDEKKFCQFMSYHINC